MIKKSIITFSLLFFTTNMHGMIQKILDKIAPLTIDGKKITNVDIPTDIESGILATGTLSDGSRVTVYKDHQKKHASKIESGPNIFSYPDKGGSHLFRMHSFVRRKNNKESKQKLRKTVSDFNKNKKNNQDELIDQL